MKKLYTFLAAILLTATTFAQAPEQMSYQAVVRDSDNDLVTNQSVGMQISILQGSATGTVVYEETQTPSTNANGLVTLEIGTGTTLDDFTSIDWSNGTYFIKTETDPTGGASYSITGISQLLSVPYALHAKTAENVTNDLVDDADADPNNEMQDISLTGTDFSISGGSTVDLSALQDGTGTDDQNISGSGLSGTVLTIGIEDGTSETIDLSMLQDVYKAGSGIDITNNVVSTTEPTYTIGLWPELGGYVFWVSDDGKHGLVAETQDQIVGSNWYGGQNAISNPSNHSVNGQRYRDWRMPTKYELNEIYLQKGAIGGFTPSDYWSSSEFDTNLAWRQYFVNGLQTNFNKDNLGNAVRSVRAF